MRIAARGHYGVREAALQSKYLALTVRIFSVMVLGSPENGDL